MGFGSDFIALPNDAVFGNQNLRGALVHLEVASFKPIAPWFRHIPTPQFDRWGNEITLTDLKDDYLVLFPDDQPVDLLIERLNGLPGITSAQVEPDASYFAFTPDDPHFPDQWGFQNHGGAYGIPYDGSCPPGGPPADCIADMDVNAPEAWDLVRKAGTKIGVIDSGVRDTHEDIEGSLDLELSDVGDACGHGTQVSGVLAAVGSNGRGVAGVIRPDSSLGAGTLVLLSNYDGVDCEGDPGLSSAALSTFAGDVTYYPQVLVVNESFGVPIADKWAYAPVVRDAHRNAYLKGIAVIAAAGWDGCFALAESCWVYPAAFNHLALAAGGHDCRGGSPHASHRMNHVDLVAPMDVPIAPHFSADNAYAGKNGIQASCGTSFSAPMVSGAAGLLLEADPDLTVDDIFAVLRKTAEDPNEPGWDYLYGHGRLRLDAAIAYVSGENRIHHGSAFAWSAATMLTARSQQFMNIPGVNSAPEVWESFVVVPWRVDVPAPFTDLSPGEVVLDAWPQHRLSQGFPNDPKIDGNLLTGYAELVPGSLSPSGCTLRTYTYLIWRQGGGTCWWPIRLNSVSPCFPATSTFRLDYSYVGSLGGGQPRLPGSGEGTGSKNPGSAKLASGPGGDEVLVDIYDVGGRLIATLDVGPLGLAVDATATIRARAAFLPSGVYFAAERKGDRIGGIRKIVLVR